MARDTVVVCPLRFEAAALARAGIGRLALLEQCGAGADAGARWARARARAEGRGEVRLLIVGVGGALRDTVAAGTCVVAEAVVDTGGSRWVPTWPVPSDTPTARFLTTTTTVVTPARKRRLAEESGADVVDLETAAIAAVAEDAGWTWTAIRAISDDLEMTLPTQIDTWVGDDGRSRPWPILRDLAAHPRHLRTMWRLARDGRRGLAAAAAVIERLLANPP